jgi:hypothetical protein
VTGALPHDLFIIVIAVITVGSFCLEFFTPSLPASRRGTLCVNLPGKPVAFFESSLRLKNGVFPVLYY